MLKRIFGSDENPQTPRSPERAHLERLLAEIALYTPRAEWAALVNSDGLLQAAFPSLTGDDPYRVGAMSAAMDALGRRIASELKDGELQYMTIAGELEITLMIVLSPKYMLTIGLSPNVSIAEFLRRLQETIVPLMKAISLHGRVQFVGIR